MRRASHLTAGAPGFDCRRMARARRHRSRTRHLRTAKAGSSRRGRAWTSSRGTPHQGSLPRRRYHHLGGAGTGGPSDDSRRRPTPSSRWPTCTCGCRSRRRRSGSPLDSSHPRGRSCRQQGMDRRRAADIPRSPPAPEAVRGFSRGESRRNGRPRELQRHCGATHSGDGERQAEATSRLPLMVEYARPKFAAVARRPRRGPSAPMEPRRRSVDLGAQRRAPRGAHGPRGRAHPSARR
jgi:hypothetical protein